MHYIAADDSKQLTLQARHCTKYPLKGLPFDTARLSIGHKVLYCLIHTIRPASGGGEQ